MNLQNRLEKLIPQDKLFHFIVGNFIFEFCMYICIIHAQYRDLKSIVISMVITIITAILKELYDKYKKKAIFDWYDVLATTVGITPRFIIIGVVFLIFRVLNILK